MVEIRRGPRIRAVARAAFRCRRDVRCSFTRCLGPVVAAGAGADHVIVADGLGWAPGGGGVAIGASVAGVEMGRAFASSGRAVVARWAGAGYVGVVEIRRGPRIRAVTRAAFRRRGNVRCSLAHCLGPVVTARAGPDHVIVIDGLGWAPCRGCVAIRASVAGAKVRRALASRIGPIVAA